MKSFFISIFSLLIVCLYYSYAIDIGNNQNYIMLKNFCIIAESKADNYSAYHNHRSHINRYKSDALGVYIMPKIGINIPKIYGINNYPSVNPLPDFGLKYFIPYNKQADFGFLFDIGFAQSSWQEHYISAVYNNIYVNTKIEYAAISQSFVYKCFNLGFCIKLPIEGQFYSLHLYDREPEYETETDNLLKVIELHLGAAIPIVKTIHYNLNLDIKCSYDLTNSIKNTDDGSPRRNASFGIGISYLYNLSNYIIKH